MVKMSASGHDVVQLVSHIKIVAQVLGVSISVPAPFCVVGMAADGPRSWAVAIHVRDVVGNPLSFTWPNTAPDIVAI